MANFSAAMSSRELAFFAIEHGLTMFLAVVLVHLGSTFARRAATDVARQRTAAIWFTIATLVVLLAIPWWRPLLRI